MKIAITTSSFARYSDEPLKLLEQAGVEYVMNDKGRALTEEEAIQILEGCHGVAAGTEPLTKKVMDALPDLKVAAELGADIDALVPPSVRHAQAGATVIAQLASFPETVTSADEAELTLRSQSRRLHCGMIMAAPGKGESTTDNVFSGLCMIAENGEIIRSFAA